MLAYNIHSGFCKHLFEADVFAYEVPFNHAVAMLCGFFGIPRNQAVRFLDGHAGARFAEDLTARLQQIGLYDADRGCDCSWRLPADLACLCECLAGVLGDRVGKYGKHWADWQAA